MNHHNKKNMQIMSEATTKRRWEFRTQSIIKRELIQLETLMSIFCIVNDAGRPMASIRHLIRIYLIRLKPIWRLLNANRMTLQSIIRYIATKQIGLPFNVVHSTNTSRFQTNKIDFTIL